MHHIHTEGTFLLTKNDIEVSIKKTLIDTSPGSGGIVIHILQNVKCTNGIWAIRKVMLEWN